MFKIKSLLWLCLTLLCLFSLPTAAHAQSSTTTIRGTGLQPLVEESGSTQTLNIYGPGGVIIAQVATDSPAGGTPTTQTRYLLHDHLGSTRVVLDSSNQVLGSFDYSPFGETTPTGNMANVAYRYTGQEVNDVLGTYNYHARHYDAGVGRFLTVDPARQFASSYAYVGNNPVNRIDPKGTISEIGNSDLTMFAIHFKARSPLARRLFDTIQGKYTSDGTHFEANNPSLSRAERTQGAAAARPSVISTTPEILAQVHTTARQNEGVYDRAILGLRASRADAEQFIYLSMGQWTYASADQTAGVVTDQLSSCAALCLYDRNFQNTGFAHIPGSHPALLPGIDELVTLFSHREDVNALYYSPESGIRNSILVDRLVAAGIPKQNIVGYIHIGGSDAFGISLRDGSIGEISSRDFLKAARESDFFGASSSDGAYSESEGSDDDF